MWSCTINHQVKWVNAGAKRGRDKEHERDYSFILKMIKKIWATQNTNALVQQKFRMSFHSLDWHCNCDIAWKCTAKSLIRFHFVHLYMGVCVCVCVCSTVERLTCLCEYVCVTRWLLANVNELGFFQLFVCVKPQMIFSRCLITLDLLLPCLDLVHLLFCCRCNIVCHHNESPYCHIV